MIESSVEKNCKIIFYLQIVSRVDSLEKARAIFSANQRSCFAYFHFPALCAGCTELSALIYRHRRSALFWEKAAI